MAPSSTTSIVPWAYLRKGDWHILSAADSGVFPPSLSRRFNLLCRFVELLENSKDDTPVPVKNGELLVSVRDRTLTTAYWVEAPCPVIRCEWLFESTDGTFFPFSEVACVQMTHIWSTMPNEVHTLIYPVQDHLGGRSTVAGSPSTPQEEQLSDLFQTCASARDHRCKAVHHGFEAWVNNDHKQTAHVVFVVHGIGETYWKKRLPFITISDWVHVFDQLTQQVSESHFPDHHEGVLYFPVDWSGVMAEMGDMLHETLARTSLPSLMFIRQIQNELISDVMLYIERKDPILSFVVNHMNRVYRLYKENNPEFDGSVSIMGHSLGSVISFDMLSKQGVDSHLKLDFQVEHYFAFGSPIGAFLPLYGTVKGDDLVLPTTKNLYNIYHPIDPIAYRLEPLLHPTCDVEPPLRLSTYSGHRRFHHAVNDLINTLEAKQTALLDHISAAWSAFTHSSEPKKAATEEEVEPNHEANEIAKELALKCNPSMGRLDFVLPESAIEALTPMAALTAHVQYYENQDFCLFVLNHLFETGDKQGSVSLHPDDIAAAAP
ncbi:unnamed protein product [Aphanomyces euteiches]